MQGGVPASARLNLSEKTDLLTGRDFWTTQDYSSRGVPSLRFADGPSGLRIEAGDGTRSEMGNTLPATCFPSLAALASSWDRRLLNAVGTALGEEAAASGVRRQFSAFGPGPLKYSYRAGLRIIFPALGISTAGLGR